MGKNEGVVERGERLSDFMGEVERVIEISAYSGTILIQMPENEGNRIMTKDAAKRQGPEAKQGKHHPFSITERQKKKFFLPVIFPFMSA